MSDNFLPDPKEEERAARSNFLPDPSVPGDPGAEPVISDEELFGDMEEGRTQWEAFDDSRGLSDAFAGLGNTFNLDKLAVRAATLGRPELRKHALAALENDARVRRQRGNAYGAGKFGGEAALGAVAGGYAAKGLGTLAPAITNPIARGALAGGATGAGTAGLSSVNRTGGDLGQALYDTAMGGVTGATVGAAVPAAGQLLGKGLGTTSGSAQAANRAAQEMSTVSGTAVPKPDLATKSFVDMMAELTQSNPELAQAFVMGGKQAVYRMAQAGKLSSDQMGYMAKLIGAQRSADGNVVQKVSGFLLNKLAGAGKGGKPLTGKTWEAIENAVRPPSSSQMLQAIPQAVVRGAFPERSPRAQEEADPFEGFVDESGKGGFTDEELMPSETGDGTINLGPVNIQAGEGQGPTSYNDILDADSEMGPSPVDDIDNQAMYTAMREAVGSEAVRARPGMHRELSGVMTDWARGKAPSQDQLALLNYKLGEVPGLQWAAINPDRRET